jgi:hypothetical protein
MRFSIRELFWLTLVVGLASALWIERRAHYETDARRLEAIAQAQRLRATVIAAKKSDTRLHHILTERIGGSYSFNVVDWDVLDEPIVEP